MRQQKISFIGGGNMAQAIINGLLKQGYPADLITVSDRNAQQLEKMTALGVNATDSNSEAVENSDIVVLAVKPQVIAEVCQQINQLDFSQKILLSIAAGVTIARLQGLIPSSQQIVRAMPNTPALLSMGMTGLYANAKVLAESKAWISDILLAVGKICWVEQESDINSITAVSGSGPAYFFLFMEAMQQQAISMGLSEQMARELVEQTALGAAQMVVHNSAVEISSLREQVTSKGGTTAAALQQFEQQGLIQIVGNAMQAASERAKEMEELF